MDDLQKDPEVRRTYKALEEAISAHVKALGEADGDEGIIVTEWVACTANVSQRSLDRDADDDMMPTTGYTYLGSRTAYHSRMGLVKEHLLNFESDTGERGEDD